MKVNVVICGDIRDPLDLIMLCQKLSNYSELIHQVVVSTWADSIKKNKLLLEELSKFGITFVTSVPMKDGGVGNINRQKLQLKKGLLSLGNYESPVLKLRTDKCIDLVEPFFKYCAERRSLSKSSDEVFDFKIVVQMISLGVPFLIADKVFLGMWSDLYRLTLSVDYFENEALFGPKLGAESRWFLTPFLFKYPFFRMYFTKVNFRKTSSKLLENISNSTFPSYLHYYLNIVYKNFEIPHKSRCIYIGSYAIQNNLNTKSIHCEVRGAWSDIHIRDQSLLDAFSVPLTEEPKVLGNKFLVALNPSRIQEGPVAREVVNLKELKKTRLKDFIQIPESLKQRYRSELEDILVSQTDPTKIYCQVYKILKTDKEEDSEVTKLNILRRMVKLKNPMCAIWLYETSMNKDFPEKELVLEECRNLIKSRTGLGIEDVINRKDIRKKMTDEFSKFSGLE